MKDRENPNVPETLAAYLGRPANSFGKMTQDGYPFAESHDPEVVLLDPDNPIILTAGTGAD